MELMEFMANRRSVRLYTDEPVSEEAVDQILKAGMLGPSGKGIAPWSFIVIRDKEMLKKLHGCRKGGAKLFDTADCAIAVLGNTDLSDTCVEDCSVSLAMMHLMASSLGIGSCWLQNRLRPSDEEGVDSQTFVRSLLGFPENQMLEAMLILGHPAQDPAPHDPDALPKDKIHFEKW